MWLQWLHHTNLNLRYHPFIFRRAQQRGLCKTGIDWPSEVYDLSTGNEVLN